MQEIAPHSGGLVDAAAVARYLGCKRSWVYENAD
jgi:predicted DNA-binding transcriptional regulator AlpA